MGLHNQEVTPCNGMSQVGEDLPPVLVLACCLAVSKLETSVRNRCDAMQKRSKAAVAVDRLLGNDTCPDGLLSFAIIG